MAASVLGSLVVTTATGRQIPFEVSVPRSFFARARGLLAHSGLGPRRGMLFERCSAVHCFGMHRAIDVLFISGDGTILKCARKVKPFSVALCRGADFVVELDAGEIDRLGIRPADRAGLQLP